MSFHSFVQKSLTDLVKGLRANKESEDEFIRLAMTEIKDEIKSMDMSVKVVALQKLTYLNLVGYDMEWAAFHVIEVMSSPVFSFKRVGYLAATQCFHANTDILIMTTQLFKKDLLSSNQYESGLAISCLANICTPDLGRDLVSDVVTLLNSTRAYVRKKAVLVLFKIFLQYPDALAPTFIRLKDKLTDTHPSVVASAVNVVAELAKRNPKNYLSLAPQFFKLLTGLNNNWILIKIVKFLGELCPHEPRLAKKLAEPLTNMVNTTSAKSLLYEVLFTITKGMHDQKGVLRLAVEKLKTFVTDPDQNLKYLGLLGLNNIMSVYPKLVSDMKETILDCLNDPDVTIRYRATDLLCGVISKKNIKNIMSKLIKTCKAADGPHRNVLVEKIIGACSRDNYEFIPSFNWYLEVLAELTELKGIERGDLIASQLKNCFIRVKSIRSWGVEEMVKLINAPHIQQENLETSSIIEVLSACAWIIGEFIGEATISPQQCLDAVLKTQISSFPVTVQAIFIQTILKIYAAAAVGNTKPHSEMLLGEKVEKLGPEHFKILGDMRGKIRDSIQEFLASSDVEVQERASLTSKILQLHEEMISAGIDIGGQIKSLFEEELNPVAPGSQKKVPIPEGLDLDLWINDPEEFKEEVEKEEVVEYTTKGGKKVDNKRVGYLLPKGKNDVSIVTKDLSELGISDKPKVVKKKPLKKKPKEPEVIEKYEISNAVEKPEGYEEKPEIKVSIKDKLSEIDLSKELAQSKELPKVKEYKSVSAKDMEKKEVKKDVVAPKKEEKKKPTKEKDLLSFDEAPKVVESAPTKKKKPVEEKVEKKDKVEKKEEKKPSSTKTKRKKLCHDEWITVSYNPKVLPHDPTHLDIPLHIENVGNMNITSVEYNVSSTINLRLEGKTGNVSAGFQLPVGQSGNVTLNLSYKTFDRAQTLGGNILYTVDKKGTPEKKTLPFKLKLPCSMFFVPKTITQEQFSNLIKNKEIAYSATKKIKLTDKIKDFQTCVKEVTTHLNTAVIGSSSNSAFLYGLSVQNHHLAVILALKGDSEVSIEIRTTMDSITNDLISEVVHMFKPPTK